MTQWVSARLKDGVQQRTTLSRGNIYSHTYMHILYALSLKTSIFILTSPHPPQHTDAGCKQLHHLHQEQYSLSTLQCHPVGHTEACAHILKMDVTVYGCVQPLWKICEVLKNYII